MMTYTEALMNRQRVRNAWNKIVANIKVEGQDKNPGYSDYVERSLEQADEIIAEIHAKLDDAY